MRDDDAWFAITRTDQRSEYISGKGRIEAGYYSGPGKLVRTINKVLQGLMSEKSVKLSNSPVTHKMTVHKSSHTIFMGNMNTTMLGFRADDGIVTSPSRPEGVENDSYFREADGVVDMTREFESLYVYTSVVEPRVVGESLVPLLRIVPLSGERCGTVSKSRSTYLCCAKSSERSRSI